VGGTSTPTEDYLVICDQLDRPVWECLATVSGSFDISGFGKFVPLLSFELRRGRVLGEMVNVVLLVQ